MNDRWSKASMALHWGAALLIGVIVAAGFVMTDLPPDAVARRNLGRVHSIGGVLLAVLTVARLVVRRRLPRPEPLPLPPLHRRGVGVVHVLLYGGLLATAATGFVTARLSGEWHPYLSGDRPVVPDLHHLPTRTVHELLVPALLLLVAAHVVGVAVQELRRGGALRRMVPFLR